MERPPGRQEHLSPPQTPHSELQHTSWNKFLAGNCLDVFETPTKRRIHQDPSLFLRHTAVLPCWPGIMPGWWFWTVTTSCPETVIPFGNKPPGRGMRGRPNRSHWKTWRGPMNIRILLYYIIWCYVIWYYIILYYIILYYIIQYHVLLHYIILYHIILYALHYIIYYIILHYIILYNNNNTLHIIY